MKKRNRLGHKIVQGLIVFTIILSNALFYNSTALAAGPATVDPDNNSFILSNTSPTTGIPVTITASGDRQFVDGIEDRDERYIPLDWSEDKTNTHGGFSLNNGKYTAIFSPTLAETYTITVTFLKQYFNAGTNEWESEWDLDKDYDLKSLSLTAVASPSPANNANNTFNIDSDSSILTLYEDYTVIAIGDRQGLETGATDGQERYVPERWSSTDSYGDLFHVDGSGEYTSVYRPNKIGPQEITVQYKLEIWDDANETWVATVITDEKKQSIQVTRDLIVANPDWNYVNLSSTGVIRVNLNQELKVTATAEKQDLDDSDALEGDTRYFPDSYQFDSNSGEFTIDNFSTYSATLHPSIPGKRTLTVTFRKEEFDGTQWVDLDDDDIRTLTIPVSYSATIANRGQNKATLSSNTIFEGETVTLTAEGHRQSEAGVSHEDERFIATQWRLMKDGNVVIHYNENPLNDENHYTATVIPPGTGQYVVEVNFIMQRYDMLSETWSFIMADDTKEVPLNVVLPANPDNNKVNASPGSVTSGDSFTLIAEGDRESEIGGFVGNERYIPSSWVSSDGESGSFAKGGADYTSFYKPSAAGDNTVTVTFIKQVWDGTKWEDTGADDQKEIVLEANIAAADADNNSISASPDSITSDVDVTVTISGDRQSAIGWFDGDERFIPVSWKSTDGQSGDLDDSIGSFEYSSSTRGTHTITATFQKQVWDATGGKWADVNGVTDEKTTTVSVIVSASNTGNTVSVNPDSVTSGGSVTVKAEGDRQSEDGLAEGDERYVPVSWTSTDSQSGTFVKDGTDYTSDYKPSAAGTQTVTVTFQKQIWDETDEEWVDVDGVTDTKTTIVEAQTATVDANGNDINASSEYVLSGESVTVATKGDRQTATGLFEGDERFVPVSWESTDGQTDTLDADSEDFSYTPSTAGPQTVTVTFQKQTWDATNEQWVDDSGVTDTKTTTIEAVAVSADESKNSVSADPDKVTSGGAVTVTISGDHQTATGLFEGDERFVPVSWESTDGKFDTLAAGNDNFSYTPTAAGTQTVTVTFQKQTWDATSNQWIDDSGVTDTKTAIVRVIMPASDTDNIVSVSPGSVTSGGSVTVTAEGDRQSEDGLTQGDERYVPVSWTSTDSQSGMFTKDGTDYTSDYKPSAAGTQTVTVTFQKQAWDETDEEWVDVDGVTDTKTTTVEAVPVEADTNNNSVTVDASSVSSGEPVTVTVSGDRQTATGLFEGDERFVPISWESTDGQLGILDADSEDLSYTPSAAGTQTVTVTFQKQIWDATSERWVDDSGVTDTKTTTVEAIAVAADASKNSVSADPDNVTTGGTVTVTVNGDRQSETGFLEGDERYVPISWESTDGQSDTLDSSDENFQYSPTVAGTQTLTIVFQKQIWDGITWVDDTTVSESVDVKVNSPYVPSTNVDGTQTTGVDVLVNGKVENAGTATTSKVNGRSVTNIAVDQEKLEAKLAEEGQHAIVTIPISMNSEILVGELNGQMIKHMEQMQAILEIRTDKAAYTVPAAQINLNDMLERVGMNVNPQDIKVQIEIAEPTEDTIKIVEHSAKQGEFTIIAPTFDFTVRSSYGDTTIEVSKFSVYVERMIAIPDGVDPNKITTGIVVDPDGTVRHVPTQVIVIDGKYYAKINSLTNSTYSVIWHPLEFSDMTNHWAKNEVNNMGSRLVVNGVGNDMYDPDADITRAEFAAIVVRGLGLKPEKGASAFTDVAASAWYNEVVHTAAAYDLINGYEDGTFRPNERITREQAMAIIARAMRTTGLKDELAAQTVGAVLRSYTDAGQVSNWALQEVADNVQAGIISGRNANTIAPLDYITRAEVAVVIQRLLQQSELI